MLAGRVSSDTKGVIREAALLETAAKPAALGSDIATNCSINKSRADLFKIKIKNKNEEEKKN